MKKSIKIGEKTVDITDDQYFCDFYPNKKGVSELILKGWYGSDFDLGIYRFEFSDQAAIEILKFIEGKLMDTKIKDHYSNACVPEAESLDLNNY